MGSASGVERSVAAVEGRGACGEVVEGREAAKLMNHFMFVLQ